MRAKQWVFIGLILVVGVLATLGAGVTQNRFARDANNAWVLSGSVAEGHNATASGDNSHAEGTNCIASGSQAHAEGESSDATGEISHAEGDGSLASGALSHAEGQSTVASGEGSHAQGVFSKAYLYAQHAQASFRFAADGDAQHSRIVLYQAITHSDAAWYSIDAATKRAIPVDTLWTFDILLSGASVGLAKTFSYHIIGSIENDGGTTVLNAHTVTTIYETDADFDAKIVADDTNDALAIQVTDTTSGSDVVRWVADVRLCEVGFPAA